MRRLAMASACWMGIVLTATVVGFIALGALMPVDRPTSGLRFISEAPADEPAKDWLVLEHADWIVLDSPAGADWSVIQRAHVVAPGEPRRPNCKCPSCLDEATCEQLGCECRQDDRASSAALSQRGGAETVTYAVAYDMAVRQGRDLYVCVGADVEKAKRAAERDGALFCVATASDGFEPGVWHLTPENGKLYFKRVDRSTTLPTTGTDDDCPE